MRIKRVKITNFRNLAIPDLDLAPLSILVGREAEGKSGFIAALRVALDGRCEGINERGEGRERLVRYGAEKAVVALGMAGGVNVHREIAAGKNFLKVGGVEAKGAGVAANEAALFSALGTTATGIALAFSPLSFFALPEDGQRKVLFEMLGASAITRDDLISALNSEHKDMGAWAAEQKLLEYQPAYDARRDGKKLLEELRAREKGLASITPPEAFDALREAEIEQEIAEQRKALADARTKLQEIAEAEGRIVRLREDLTRESSQQKHSEEAGKQLTEKKRLLAQAEKNLAAKEKALATERETLAGMRDLAVSAQALQTFREELLQGPCALLDCECPVDTRVIQVSDKLRAGAKASEGLEKEQARVIALGNDQQELAKQERELRASIARLEASPSAAAAKKRVTDLEGAISKAEDALAGRKAEAYVSAIERTEHSLAALETEQHVLAQKIGARDAYNQATADLPKLQEKIKAQEQQVSRLEELVEALAPGGVKARILGGKRGEIEAVLNGVLASWGWSGEVDAESQQLYLLRQGARIPWVSLSKSEKMRFGIAVQVAAGSKFGARFLAVDDVECMTAEGRGVLVKALLGLIRSDVLDQVIIASVLSTAGPDGKTIPPAASTIPEVGVYLVEGGAVRLLEPAAVEVAA